jgi:hypothetical protein
MLVGEMVGAVRFELTTSCTRNKRASQATLRPTQGRRKCPWSPARSKEPDVGSALLGFDGEHPGIELATWPLSAAMELDFVAKQTRAAANKGYKRVIAS